MFQKNLKVHDAFQVNTVLHFSCIQCTPQAHTLTSNVESDKVRFCLSV